MPEAVGHERCSVRGRDRKEREFARRGEMADATLDRCAVRRCVIVDKPHTAIGIGCQPPDVDHLFSADALRAWNRKVCHVARRSEKADRVGNCRLLKEPHISIRSGRHKARVNLDIENGSAQLVAWDIGAQWVDGKQRQQQQSKERTFHLIAFREALIVAGRMQATPGPVTKANESRCGAAGASWSWQETARMRAVLAILATDRYGVAPSMLGQSEFPRRGVVMRGNGESW